MIGKRAHVGNDKNHFEKVMTFAPTERKWFKKRPHSEPNSPAKIREDYNLFKLIPQD